MLDFFEDYEEHEFSDRTTVKVPTFEEDGLDTVTCNICSTEKEIVTSLKNLAFGANIVASDGKNAYVYTSDMVDGNTDTKWVNGTSTPSVQLSFDKSTVNYAEISFSKWLNNQTFTVSVYDGTEWKEILEWIDTEETYGSDMITVKFDVNEEISSIKFEFDNTSSGCTNIHEISIIATIDK